jgi:prevent-host-death family protein
MRWHIMAIKAGIRELKSRLSAYLRMVKSGQTVIITERGKVIGYLSPAAPSLEERMQALETAGLLRRAKGKLPPYEPKVANPGLKLASDIVSEGRNSDYLP